MDTGRGMGKGMSGGGAMCCWSHPEGASVALLRISFVFVESRGERLAIRCRAEEALRAIGVVG